MADPSFAQGSTCHRSAAPGDDVAKLATSPAGWQCSGSDFGASRGRHLVRFDLTGAGRPAVQPRYVEFERHAFSRATVTVLAPGGLARSRVYQFATTPLGASSLRSILELPETDAMPSAVVVTLDDSQFPGALLAVELRAEPTVHSTAGLPHLLAALLCGLLLAPIVFDLGYFRTLRENFPLYHALFCIMAFVQTAAVSGLIPLIVHLPFRAEMLVTYLSLDAMIAATFLFAYNFLERASLAAWHRPAIAALVAVIAINGIATTMWPEWFGYWVDHIYLGVLMSAMACYFRILFICWRRGSRAAPYLALGIFPFTLVQLVQALYIYTAERSYTFDETWPQNLALLFEVVATAMAVADRFMSVRRERDMALDEARILGALSERDDLTGLLNRRALDAHYPSLLAEGFTALAVLDIDHFKSINDIHGHPVGDAVLRCTADALRAADDRDMRAFRIGGEEFLLLIRGSRVEERAEQRRRAISARVAADVPALDRPVTASMGLVEFSAIASEAGADFSALYSRADWLLYEAKRLGRNRTLTESLEMFDPATVADWQAEAKIA